MTPAEATALDILKWAVSPDRPVPQGEALEEELLMDLAVHHRLLGPLVSRLDAARPRWCPPRLLTRLRIVQHQTRQRVHRKIIAARDISRAMRARGLAPPIFVKGFAAYALTADATLMHYSGDLDPFAEDLPAFEAVLHELGYTGKRKDTHEWAKLNRGESTLDVHQFFPSLAYPDAVRLLPAEQLEARQNPGHWQMPAEESRLTFRETPIRWEHLSEEAVPGAAAGTEEILFPSPTQLCLIHCAHCFRVSVTRLHYMDLFGGFRLYELLSIHALARLPGFDAARFSALVEQFGAQDAVRLVNALAETTFGMNAVPEQGGRLPAEAPVLPERLLYGGWVSLQGTEGLLLLRGFEQMLTQLDVNIVPATCRLASRDVPRLLTYGPSPPLLQVAVVWDASQNSVVLDWTFPDAHVDGAEHELLIHFGSGSFVTVSLDAGWNVRAVSQKSDYGSMDGHAADVGSAATGPAIRVTCSVPTFPGASPAPPDSLPLFLAMRRLCRDGEDAEAAAYLPLRLVA